MAGDPLGPDNTKPESTGRGHRSPEVLRTLGARETRGAACGWPAHSCSRPRALRQVVAGGGGAALPDGEGQDGSLSASEHLP